MIQTTDTPRADQTPPDDELKRTLMATAGLHHQLLTVVMTILRIVLVLGGIIVAVRLADSLFT